MVRRVSVLLPTFIGDRFFLVNMELVVMKVLVLVKPVYAGEGDFYDDVVGVYSTDAKAEEASKSLKIDYGHQAVIRSFELDEAPAKWHLK